MLLSSYIDIGLILAFIGAAGILTNHQHILLSLLSVELIFYGLNFFLVILAVQVDDAHMEIFALFVLALSAAESALALALLLSYFRVYGNILIRNF